jgi:ATP-binding cassette, subfamily B, bacterial CvaB/MchF/RaxB
MQRKTRPGKIKLIRQYEIHECGIACVLMIVNQYVKGRPVEFSSFRRRVESQGPQVSLLDLRKLARELGLQPSVLRIRDDVIGNIKGSFIAHWDRDHYVVVERVTNRQVLVHDPAVGTEWLDMEAFLSHFTGVIMEFNPPHPIISEAVGSPRQNLSQLVRKLVGRAKGVRASVLCILTLGVAIEALALSMPLMTKNVVDNLVQHDLSSSHNLLVIALCFTTVATFQALLLHIRFEALARLAALFNLNWIKNTVHHLLRLPLSYFERRRVVDIASRVSAIETIQRTIAIGLVSSGLDGLMAITGIAFMTYYSPLLAVVVAIAFAVYTAVRVITHGHLDKLATRRVLSSAKLGAEILESLRSMQAIKLAGLEALREERYMVNAKTVQSMDYQLSRLNSTITVAGFGISAMQRIVMLILAYVLVNRGQLTIGGAMACIALAEQFIGRGPSFIDRIVDLRLIKIHMERLADITEAAKEVVKIPNTSKIFEATATTPLRITAKNIGFRHPGTSRWLFRNIDFDIQPGTCALLDGPSGIGKTTLLKVLLGLIEPSEGSVLVNGLSLACWNQSQYRSLCASVMQDDCVMAGSVNENIGFFDKTVTQDEIKEAARLVNVDNEICQLPMAYSTIISDLDSTLSGGQRQRILIARALCRKSRLLVLDEAFSHLDATNRKEIGIAIQKLGMTRIVVSHTEHDYHQPDMIIRLG